MHAWKWLILHIATICSSPHEYFLLIEYDLIRRCQEFYDMCQAARVKVLFLPPYSPEYNPIELAFNHFKSIVKRRIRSLREIDDSIAVASELMNIWGRVMPHGGPTWSRFIRHAGYEVPNEYTK
jgi:hypothetical protein